MEMITCSPMVGQFFDTMIVASSDKEWLSRPIKISLQAGSPYGLFRDLIAFEELGGARETEPVMILVRFEFCLLFRLTDLSPRVIA